MWLQPEKGSLDQRKKNSRSLFWKVYQTVASSSTSANQRASAVTLNNKLLTRCTFDDFFRHIFSDSIVVVFVCLHFSRSYLTSVRPFLLIGGTNHVLCDPTTRRLSRSTNNVCDCQCDVKMFWNHAMIFAKRWFPDLFLRQRPMARLHSALLTGMSRAFNKVADVSKLDFKGNQDVVVRLRR